MAELVNNFATDGAGKKYPQANEEDCSTFVLCV